MNVVEDLWTKIEKEGLSLSNDTIESTVVIVGESGCGKSSIIQNYLKVIIILRYVTKTYYLIFILLLFL